jgi:hypothetical protein
LLPTRPRYEYRAWSQSFPNLPRPEAESWSEETYIVPYGLLSRDIKIRGGALEIKELLAERNGLQLWNASSRLAFPIPALTLERELMSIVMIGQPLHRDRYGPEELVQELAEGRRNVAAVRLRKRRHVFESHGCRAETAEIEVGEKHLMSAAAEHEHPETLLGAIAAMGLDRYPNLSYVQALSRLPGMPPIDTTAT